MSHDSPQTAERTALEVAEHCPLSEDARALLAPELAAASYEALLISQEKYADAIRFTAFNLSKREAVWWGAMCLWEGSRPEQGNALSLPVATVFETLLAWLKDPSETNRRAVETAGRDAGDTTPHGQLAMAAFFSEGSMSLPGRPNVEPEPWLTARTVASVVLAASRMKKASKINASQRSFLVLAVELIEGQLPWTSLDESELTAPAV